MEIKRKQALKILWKDICSIFVRGEVIDEETKLTDFREVLLLKNEPCKLSFETLTATVGDETAAVAQSAKLFLSSTCTVPAGSKIVVTIGERTFVFTRSG